MLDPGIFSGGSGWQAVLYCKLGSGASAASPVRMCEKEGESFFAALCRACPSKGACTQREKEEKNVSKKDIGRYMKKQKTQEKQSVNSVFADALKNIKLD